MLNATFERERVSAEKREIAVLFDGLRIETIDAIPGLAPDASHDAKMKAVNTLAAKRGRELGGEGIYLLLSKNDKVFSNVLVGERYAGVLSGAKRRAIGDALVSSFKAGDFDGGLTNAADALVAALSDGPVAARLVTGFCPAW